MPKSRLANRFVFAVHRETNVMWSRMLKDYSDREKFYINLGREMSESALATLVGANNSEPVTGPKFYVHSQRKAKVK